MLGDGHDLTLVAVDLDGTLLDSRKEITEPVARALADVAERGVTVAFSSGRNVPECEHYQRQLPFVRYASLVNGAVVYDFFERRCISVRAIDDALARELLSIASAEDVLVQVLAPEYSVEPTSGFRRLADFGQGQFTELLAEIGTFVDDIDEWMAAHPGRITKVNLHHTSAEARKRTAARLANWPLTKTPGLGNTLELTAPGIDKGLGLATLARATGTTLNHVVAIGDADNDLAALAAAGIGVAMGNAHAAVRAVADLVVADSNHDGVAEAIQTLFALG